MEVFVAHVEFYFLIGFYELRTSVMKCKLLNLPWHAVFGVYVIFAYFFMCTISLLFHIKLSSWSATVQTPR
jgi:hypothetical protein